MDKSSRPTYPDAITSLTSPIDRNLSLPGEFAMSPPARAEFIGGPFDGLIIDIEQVERFVRDDAVQESSDNRLFLLMPPPWDWDRIVEGKASRDGPFDQSYPYEVSARSGGLKLLYCGLMRYREAMGSRGPSG